MCDLKHQALTHSKNNIYTIVHLVNRRPSVVAGLPGTLQSGLKQKSIIAMKHIEKTLIIHRAVVLLRDKRVQIVRLSLALSCSKVYSDLIQGLTLSPDFSSTFK